MTSDVAIKC